MCVCVLLAPHSPHDHSHLFGFCKCNKGSGKHGKEGRFWRETPLASIIEHLSIGPRLARASNDSLLPRWRKRVGASSTLPQPVYHLLLFITFRSPDQSRPVECLQRLEDIFFIVVDRPRTSSFFAFEIHRLVHMFAIGSDPRFCEFVLAVIRDFCCVYSLQSFST